MSPAAGRPVNSIDPLRAVRKTSASPTATNNITVAILIATRHAPCRPWISEGAQCVGPRATSAGTKAS